jgi:hypothetical protein
METKIVRRTRDIISHIRRQGRWFPPRDPVPQWPGEAEIGGHVNTDRHRMPEKNSYRWGARWRRWHKDGQ